MGMDCPPLVLTPNHAVRHGPRLRCGLDLVTVSLLLIPATPVILLLTVATDPETSWLTWLVALVVLEHILWLNGLRVATEYAVTHPQTRGAAVWARRAALVNTFALVLLLPAFGLIAGAESNFLWGCAYTGLAVVLASRGVAWCLGTGAVSAVLRALGFVKTALALRALAEMACAVVAVSVAGLVLLRYAQTHAATTPEAASMYEWGYFLLLVGLPALWIIALTAGALCLRATKQLQYRFGRAAAAMRRGAASIAR